MIGFFREFSERVRSLSTAVEGVAVLLQADLEERAATGNVDARLSELERTLERRDAQTRALLEEVEARFRGVRASEERARHMLRRIDGEEADAEGSDEEGVEPFDAWLAQMAEGHAEGGGGEGLPAMHPGVAVQPSQKELARMAKWGGGG